MEFRVSVQRPFADKRPFGPIFGQSNSSTIQTRLTPDIREKIGFEEGGNVKMFFHSSESMPELGNGKVSVVITSPPYNVDYEYGSVSDAKDYKEYMSLLASVFTESYKKLMPEGRLCVNVPTIDKTNDSTIGSGNIPVAADLTDMLVDDPSFDNKFDTPEVDKLKRETDYRLFDHIIWDKQSVTSTDTPLGSLPRPFRFPHNITHESILVFQKPGKRNLSLVENERLEASELDKEQFTTEGGPDSLKDNVWNIRAQDDIKVNGERVPVFPKKIPKWLIQSYSFVGDIVVDPFAGAGTTLMAAKDTDRLGVGYEIRSELKPLIEDRVGEDV